jgi:hypothetical protein
MPLLAHLDVPDLVFQQPAKRSDSTQLPVAMGTLSLDVLFPATANADRPSGSKATVLLFADATVPAHLAAISARMTQLEDSPIHIVVVSNNPAVVRTSLRPEVQKVFYSDESLFSSALKTFRISRGIPSWLVYDHHGQFRGRGLYDSDAIGYFVRQAVAADSSYSSEYLVRLASQHFGSPATIVSGQPEQTQAVILLGKFNTGCGEYLMISAVSKLVKQGQMSAVVLPFEDISTQEAQRLIGNLRLPMAVAVPEPSQRALWMDLRAKFGLGSVNGSVLFLNSGKVIGAAIRPSEVLKRAKS